MLVQRPVAQPRLWCVLLLLQDRKSAVLTVIAPSTMQPPSAGTAASPGAAGAGPAAAAAGVVMVAGATGGVGKRVVERLLGEGRRVRALVRDVDKARGMLVSDATALAGWLAGRLAGCGRACRRMHVLCALCLGVAGVIIR